MPETVGLIAGAGRFPIEIARAAQLSGLRVVTVAIRDLADPELESEAADCHWLYLGELGSLLRLFREAGVRRCVMAGKVPKTFLYDRGRELRPDERALGLLRDLVDRSDDSILLALAALLESEGFVLERQASFTPELLAPEGPLGTLVPEPEHWQEIRFGWPIARALGRLDVGQSVVVDLPANAPAPPPKAASEDNAAYLARLLALDNAQLGATAFARGTGGIGTVLAPQVLDTTVLHVAVVETEVSAPVASGNVPGNACSTRSATRASTLLVRPGTRFCSCTTSGIPASRAASPPGPAA